MFRVCLSQSQLWFRRFRVELGESNSSYIFVKLNLKLRFRFGQCTFGSRFKLGFKLLFQRWRVRDIDLGAGAGAGRGTVAGGRGWPGRRGGSGG